MRTPTRSPSGQSPRTPTMARLGGRSGTCGLRRQCRRDLARNRTATGTGQTASTTTAGQETQRSRTRRELQRPCREPRSTGRSTTSGERRRSVSS
eukprot:7013762-Prymnesium_polylepis.2